MAYREPRPPRSAPPRGTPSSLPSYSSNERPSAQPSQNSRGNVSFQTVERGDRSAPVDDARARNFTAYRDSPLPPTPSDLSNAEGGGFDARVARKKSLVKPDREKIEPGHRQWHYRTHAAQLEDTGGGRLGLMPSSEFLLSVSAMSARLDTSSLCMLASA